MRKKSRVNLVLPGGNPSLYFYFYFFYFREIYFKFLIVFSNVNMFLFEFC